jgi:hypothetical protein
LQAGAGGPRHCRRRLKLGIEPRSILPSSPQDNDHSGCYPENSVLTCCLLACSPPVLSGIDEPTLLNKRISLMPREVVAVTRTLCLVCVVLVAFELGEMSVSFTGTQLGWMVLAGFILLLIVLSSELLRAIWATDRT